MVLEKKASYSFLKVRKEYLDHFFSIEQIESGFEKRFLKCLKILLEKHNKQDKCYVHQVLVRHPWNYPVLTRTDSMHASHDLM